MQMQRSAGHHLHDLATERTDEYELRMNETVKSNITNGGINYSTHINIA
jgi:hypothetical protein